MKYRIVEEDRNTETVTRDSVTDLGRWDGSSSTHVFLRSDSGQLINWRFIRRLVPMADESAPMTHPTLPTCLTADCTDTQPHRHVPDTQGAVVARSVAGEYRSYPSSEPAPWGSPEPRTSAAKTPLGGRFLFGPGGWR